MSQQINLLLPELRPRFDWLALPVVGSAALLALLLLVAVGSYNLVRSNGLSARDANLRTQVQGLQQQVQQLATRLGARRGDTALDDQLAAARLAVTQRQEVLDIVARGDLAAGSTYSGLLQGFARQGMNGVWLVGFGFAQNDIEIRGRLAEPALLPAYIQRLNGEPAFAGRQFAALDMQGVDPSAVRPGEAAPAPVAERPRQPRYTEFVLRTGREKAR